MTPLLWLAATATGDAHVVDGLLPPVKMIGDIPSYALDKHTAIGKAAIHRLARQNRVVRARCWRLTSPSTEPTPSPA